MVSVSHLSIKPYMLKKIISNLLVTMKLEGISSVSDIERLAGERVSADPRSKDFLSIALRKNEADSVSHTIDYVTPARGTPLRVSIDPLLGKSLIIFNVACPVTGYKKCNTDIHGNITHYKMLNSTSIPRIKSELLAFLNH